MENRLPPQAIEAEEAVLGAILLENHSIDRAAQIIQPDDFYKEAHRRIYIAMLDLAESESPVDVISLPEILKSREELDRVGGVSYITSLVNYIPNAANINYHCRIVREKAVLRNLINEASNLITRAYEGPEDIDDFISDAGGVFLSIAENRQTRGLVGPKVYVHGAVEGMERNADKKGGLTGLSTGLSSLDEVTGGLQRGDLIIVGARPSMGKTALAVNNIGLTAAMDGLPVAIFSLETTKERLGVRLLAADAEVNSKRARDGNLDADEWTKVIDSAGRIVKTNLFINDTSSMTAFDILAQCRTMKRQRGLGLVIIDYLQLMKSHKKTHSREQEIAEISRTLKGGAKALGVPIVALSQLSRSLESRQDKRPTLADLRESGALEQDADLIIFIHREERYTPCTCYEGAPCQCGRRGAAIINVAKQKDGPVKELNMNYIEQYTRFESSLT